MNDRLDKEEIQLRLLRLLEKNPDLTQRGMTRGIGISLGKVNYCLSLCVRVVVASIEQKSLQFDRAIERLHDNRIFTGV